MAKIDAPQKHGSVGCSTFLSTPNGLIERQRVKPRDPRTFAQQTIRGRVAGYASQWRELDEAQRASWRALASQLPGRLAGHHAYIKVNTIRKNCGLLEVKMAPLLPLFGRLLCTGLVADDTPTVRLTGLTDTVAPDAFIVEATPPLSAGILFAGRSWRQLPAVPGHAGPGADLDLTAAYVARFGAPEAGQRIFVRVCAMKDGFRDDPVQWNAIVGQRGF